MSIQKVQATVCVKSENFSQALEETVVEPSTADRTCYYEELIAANERLKVNISKIFTEFVNKARLEQESSGDKKKRKIEHEDDDEEEDDTEQKEDEEDGNDSEDAGSSSQDAE